jgi:hypothetical protein
VFLFALLKVPVLHTELFVINYSIVKLNNRIFGKQSQGKIRNFCNASVTGWGAPKNFSFPAEKTGVWHFQVVPSFRHGKEETDSPTLGHR